MTVHWLHARASIVSGSDPDALPGKAAALVRAAAAGLPVPQGFAIPLGAAPTTWHDAALELLRRGPVIVRSALAIEDDADYSAAGLGSSVSDVDDLDGIAAALAAIAASAPDPEVCGALGMTRASVRDHAIVQLQIDARLAVVAACEPDGALYVEAHPGGGDPFAKGEAPVHAGDPRQWDDPAASAIVEVATHTVAVFGTGRHGLDLELVVGDDGVHLVQARRLVAPLHPDWPAFVAELERRSQSIPSGTLVLDVEHNPAPLSVAHAWLIELLDARRPGAGGPIALAGWLYVRTLPRALVGSAPAGDPVVVLARLRDEILPGARARLAAIRDAVVGDDPEAIAAAFAEAIAAFVAMIDTYLGVLIPARRGHHALVAVPDDPLCLRDREAYADVLPLAWDVASPSIGVASPEHAGPAAELPRDPATAATLLREWDDHLFALGLAPLRTVVRRAAVRLGLADDDAFAATPPELAAALRGAPIDRAMLAERRADQARAASLRPPPRIVDGRPAAPPPRPGRGLPIGDDAEGPVAQRRDLDDLQRRPPPSDAIVVLPALTAPAALVLARTSVRAVITEHGGALGHGALIARELRLTALLGCRGATTIPDGTRVRIDTRTARLRRLVDVE